MTPIPSFFNGNAAAEVVERENLHRTEPFRGVFACYSQ